MRRTCRRAWEGDMASMKTAGRWVSVGGDLVPANWEPGARNLEPTRTPPGRARPVPSDTSRLAALCNCQSTGRTAYSVTGPVWERVASRPAVVTFLQLSHRPGGLVETRLAGRALTEVRWQAPDLWCWSSMVIFLHGLYHCGPGYRTRPRRIMRVVTVRCIAGVSQRIRLPGSIKPSQPVPDKG